MKNESPVIYNQSLIASNLAMLAKNKCLVSAFLGDDETILTAVLNVNYKTGTLVLDTSASKKLNQKLISTQRVKFCTVLNGTQVAFTCDSITTIRQDGYDVFLMPIPHSLYWHNRRGHHRVNTPIMSPSFCNFSLSPPTESSKVKYKYFYEEATNKITQRLWEQIEKDLVAEEEAFKVAYKKMSVQNRIEARLDWKKIQAERINNPIVPNEKLINLVRLKIYDINLTGFSMLNHDEEFSYFLNANTVYENCTIIMPNYAEITVSFRTKLKRNIKIDDTDSDGYDSHYELNELIGVEFIDTKQETESTIFRYIQYLDRLNTGKGDYFESFEGSESLEVSNS